MTISIIIKTLNEEKRIAATIESALTALEQFRQKSGDGKSGEVILADSGSSDRTIEIAARYPVTVAQIVPPARPSCGIGPQLGFQHSHGDHICLIDGDMLLDAGFLDDAVRFLADNPSLAGVTGHVEEMHVSNLEFARRVDRQAPENRTGPIDRMNGGGLYRRNAIEDVGYFSDRNLHGYEEFDLGIRLRSAGWGLHRLDRRFVQHFGHTENSYRLLVRRWKSKYLFGIGELLRASLGKPYFLQLTKELPELKLWALVHLWWLFCLGLVLLLPDKIAAIAAVFAMLFSLVALASVKKRSFGMGLYTVVAWFFHAAAVPVGLLRSRRRPDQPIESRIIGRPV